MVGHCCDPTLSVLVMLLSRNVFLVVSILQFIVGLRSIEQIERDWGRSETNIFQAETNNSMVAENCH